MTIGETVRAERKRLGLTQEALARRADMSKSGVQLIEHGQRTDLPYSSLKKLSGALGLTIGELVGETPAPGKAQAPSPPETGAAAGPETQDVAAALFGRVQGVLGERWLRWSQEVPPDTAAEVREFAEGFAALLDDPELREAARTPRALDYYSVSRALLRNLRELATHLENADSPEERREASRETEEAAGTQT